MKKQFAVICGAVALAFTGQVNAFTNLSVTSPSSPLASVSAFSNTGGTNTQAELTNGGANQTIQTATLGSYSGGVGVKNQDACGTGSCDASEGVAPEHAIDNNQRYDMVMLGFSSSVSLTSLSLGYVNTDSDLTVLRYTGTGTTLSGVTADLLSSKTYSQLASIGWTVVGNYAGGSSVGTTAINASGLYSSFWLIGAYNPLVGGTNYGSVDTGNDYFKLASVSGTVCSGGSCGSTTGKAPEPGSLALMGIGLVGLLRLRKFRKT